MERRKLKPYVGLLLVILYAVDIFWFSKVLGRHFGIYGTFIQELVLLVIAIGVPVLLRTDIKKIFPIGKPQAAKVFGTLVLWMGAFFVSMMVTLMVAYIFPQQYFSISQGLGNAFTSIPFFLSFLMVAVMPAICEEAAFRGALLGSLRGLKNKWIIIILVSLIFGAFHGSIWRLVPTAMLGVAMGYLLLETDNMFYNMLFHLVNNTVPLVLLQAIEGVSDVLEAENALDAASQITYMPLASVGIYFIYGAGAPFFLYIGDYLVHKGRPGYERGLFPREKRNIMIGLIAAAAILMAAGIAMIVLSMLSDPRFVEEIYNSGNISMLLLRIPCI